jgi:hypothetical protein
MSHEEQDDLDVQGSMEPQHRRRGYLGTARRVEGIILRLLRRIVRISRTRFLLTGVGLSRPEFTNLGKF